MKSSNLNNYLAETWPDPTDVLQNYGMLLLMYLFTFFEISTPLHPQKRKENCSHSYGGQPIPACIKQGANIKNLL
jgi:hypothetical protein